MEPSAPEEAQATIEKKRDEEDNKHDDDNGAHVEDVTPTITKREIHTVNVIPGITMDKEPEPGRLPACDSRWTIRKCFNNTPMNHPSFDGTHKKTLPCKLQKDSGANCTATDREDLLWKIKHFRAPPPVKTFDGNNDNSGETRTLEWSTTTTMS
jgi:hypothetical protein